jgi:hypothetical protein
MSMADVVARANGKVDLVIRKATIELFSSVVKGTPVDTGRARGNWQCTIGNRASTATEHTDKSGSGSISEIVATVPAKSGSVVWLTNNVPYIQKLEYGSSQQAPAGMVRINIQRFGSLLREA